MKRALVISTLTLLLLVVGLTGCIDEVAAPIPGEVINNSGSPIELSYLSTADERGVWLLEPDTEKDVSLPPGQYALKATQINTGQVIDNAAMDLLPGSESFKVVFYQTIYVDVT